jgi:hypothetical protein
MKIRIIVRWSRRSALGHFFTVCSRAKHLRCLAGHQEEVVIGDRALAVRCRVCGWRSPGLTLDGAQPRQLFR